MRCSTWFFPRTPRNPWKISYAVTPLRGLRTSTLPSNKRRCVRRKEPRSAIHNPSTHRTRAAAVITPAGMPMRSSASGLSVARVISCTIHRYLRKGVIDVRIGACRRADHAYLGHRRETAAHAIQLTAIGVGAADGSQKNIVPQTAIRRQILLMEHHRVGGAAAHKHGGDAKL